MIADHDLVFGRCHNKEPHSSGILLCRVVVVGYENMIFYGFSFFLSSPNFMLVLSLPPIFSTLYLPANFCQFFCAQVVLRTIPFHSRPIWTTLLSKVLSFFVH